MGDDALAGLELLLYAPSKEAVLGVMEDVFACRDEGWTADRRAAVAEAFSLEADADSQRQVDALFASAVHLIKAAMYANPQTAEEVEALFPEGFHPKLRSLLAKVLGKRLGPWRETAVSSPFVTAPRLMEFDWVVHTPSAASTTRAGLAPSVDRVALEVDRETLGDMVRTFAGIRDQLSVMTNK